MGFKKGTAQAIVDNELNRLNKQLLSYAKTFGLGSRQLEQTAFAIGQRIGLQHIGFNSNGVPQIKRSTKLINQIIADQNRQKDLGKLKNIKTVAQQKKEYREKMKTQYKDYNKLTSKQKDQLMKEMIDFAGNNIAENMAKYVSNTDGDVPELDDMREVGEKSGRETRALIKDDYLSRFTPVPDEYRNDESFKGIFNPVIDNETGEVVSADTGYSMIENMYRKEGLL